MQYSSLLDFSMCPTLLEIFMVPYIAILIKDSFSFFATKLQVIITSTLYEVSLTC